MNPYYRTVPVTYTSVPILSPQHILVLGTKSITLVYILKNLYIYQRHVGL